MMGFPAGVLQVQSCEQDLNVLNSRENVSFQHFNSTVFNLLASL